MRLGLEICRSARNSGWRSSKPSARDARMLILDEPTAVLAPAEAEELLRWLREFAQAGNAVVLITHKLQRGVSIADEVTVLRRGRNVLSAAAGGSHSSIGSASR